MSSIFELLDQAQPQEVQQLLPDTPGETGAGLQRGLRGAAANFNRIAATAAEAANQPEIAQGRQAVAQEFEQANAANPARVSSYKDINGLRDVLDYGTNLIGESLPALGAAGVGGLVGGTRGAIAGMTPFTAGDVAARQEQDAQAMQAPASSRLRDQLLFGAGNAALQTLVPASVAGRVVGKAAAGAASKSASSILGHVAQDVALQGAAGAGGEALTQYGVNPEKPIDTEAVKEAGVGGAVLGGVIGGAGAAGVLARKAVGAPGRAAGAAVDAVKGAAGSEGFDLGGKAAAAKEALAPNADGGYDLGGIAQGLKDNVGDAAGQAKEFLTKVAEGQDVADLNPLKGKSPADVVAMMPGLDAERAQRITNVAKGLLDSAISPETRAAVIAAMHDFSDRTNQAVVAKAQLAKDAAVDYGAKAQAAVDAFGSNEPKTGTRSEDYSGLRDAIKEHVLPAIPESALRGLDAPSTNKLINDTADVVRMLLEQASNEHAAPIPPEKLQLAIDLLGDKTSQVLVGVHRAINGENAQQAQAVFGTLNRIREMQTRDRDLIDTLTKNVRDELQDVVTTEQVRKDAQLLRKYAESTGTKTESDKYHASEIQDYLKARYGDKADVVLAAVEKDVKAERKAHPQGTMAEDAAIDLKSPETKLAEREAGQLQGETTYYGRKNAEGKPEGLVLHPDQDPAGAHGQAVQALARARKENPDRTVAFLTAAELGDHPSVDTARNELAAKHVAENPNATMEQAKAAADKQVKSMGMVVAEGTKQETFMSKADLSKVMLKEEGQKTPSANYQHPARIETGEGGPLLDGIKLTRWAEARHKGADNFTEADNKSALHRTARMFMEGVAAAQDALGHAFSIPDKTVISHGVTWGDVKGLDFSPSATKAAGGERPTSGQQERRVARMRNELRELAIKIATVKMQIERRGELPEHSSYLAHLVDRREGLIDAGKKAEDFHAQLLTEEDKARQSERPDPFGNITKLGEGAEPIRTNLTGNSREADTGTSVPKLKPAEIAALRDKFNALRDADGASAAAKAAAARGLAVLDKVDGMNKAAHRALFGLLTKGTRVSDMVSVINGLAERYKGVVKEAPAKPTAPTFDVDRMITKEDYSALTTKEATDAFLIAAKKRYLELKAEDHRVLNDDDHPTNELPAKERAAFNALSELFDRSSTADLASFYPDFDPGQGDKDTAIRAMLDKAAPEVAAKSPKGEAAGADREAVVRAGPQAEAALDANNYGATLKSAQRVDQAKTAYDQAPVLQYLDKVLGNSVQTAFKNIMHAGEFERVGVDDVISLSVHALDPLSVAHHEALHAFFAKLKDQGNVEVSRVLERVASSAPVLNQLKRLLAGEHDALKQLDTPEEAAAYMYQFWAAGKLTVGGQTNSLFTKIADALRKVLGIWSNDRRALEIMDYFDRGEFKAQLGQPSAVARALTEAGRNQAIDRLKGFTKPMRNLAESVLVAGGQQLRDTNIPALSQLADAMKLHGTAQGRDAGFLPAARTEHARVMNGVMAKLRGYTPEQMREALDAMQAGTKPASTQAKIIQRIIQGPAPDALLPAMLRYMGEAGVNVKEIAPDPNYFHRVWDAGFIAAHQGEFLSMLAKYELSGEFKGDPRDWLKRLMATDGMEFTVETNMPGMQALKQRTLAFISGEDAAPFLRKNLMENINSYVTQATRRGEWARRFGDQGERLQGLLAKAKEQGANEDQLQTANRYIKSIDGTLGDTIDPKYRRLFGNMIVYQNIRLLPLGIFSSVPDSLGIMVRGGSGADAFKTFMRGMGEIKKNFQAEGGKNDAATDMAELIGTIDSAQLMHTLGSSYSQGMVGDTGRAINDAFFRWNFMDQYNRSMRVGATQAAMNFLAKHADGTFNAHSARYMRELGYEPGEMKITDGRPDVTDPRVKAAINRWVDGAVLRPDAADTPPWMSDPRWALVSHLKKFTYSFQETILKRVAHEAAHGNYAPAMALTSYVPMMLAADMAKGVIQGGGSEPDFKKGWDLADYFGHASQRAGIYGVSQIGIDAAESIHHGGTGVGALTGPTINQLWEGVETLGGKEQPSTFVLHSMPANALYSGFAKGGGEEGPNFPD